MIVKTLMENTPLSEGCLYEHGLSFYIETKRHKLLFDMGQSDSFIKNAHSMGIDLSLVDVAILSHGHYDHGGGLEAFLRVNSRAKVYINENAFGDYYSADGRYLGLDKSLKSNERVIFTGDILEIDEELYLFTGNTYERKYYMSNFDLLCERKGERIPDEFFHEQYLVIREESGSALISGCSHKGIINIMEWARAFNVSYVLGGFHFMKLDAKKDYEYLKVAADKLLEYDAVYYTCHCTGEEQYNMLSALMGEKLKYASSGSIINL